MINYEACRKGGLARVNGLRCKCGRFITKRQAELLSNECPTCFRKGLESIGSFVDVTLEIPWLDVDPFVLYGKPPSASQGVREGLKSSSGICHERSRDFKTGDVWEEGKKEKDAVRKYAEERDRLESLGRADDKRIFLWVLSVTAYLCAALGYAVGYVVWGMR